MLPINPFDVFGRKGLEFIPVTFAAGSHVVSDEASSSGYQSPTRTGKDLTRIVCGINSTVCVPTQETTTTCTYSSRCSKSDCHRMRRVRVIE